MAVIVQTPKGTVVICSAAERDAVQQNYNDGQIYDLRTEMTDRLPNAGPADQGLIRGIAHRVRTLLERYGAILVHCQHGQMRSPLSVCAYLVAYCQYTPANAVETLQVLYESDPNKNLAGGRILPWLQMLP